MSYSDFPSPVVERGIALHKMIRWLKSLNKTKQNKNTFCAIKHTIIVFHLLH